MNVKRQSNPLPLKVCTVQCAVFNSVQHIFSQAQLFQNMMISKSMYHFGTPAGVISVMPNSGETKHFCFDCGSRGSVGRDNGRKEGYMKKRLVEKEQVDGLEDQEERMEGKENVRRKMEKRMVGKKW